MTVFLDGRVTLHAGDCLEVLAGMDEGSVDSCVCDPPYHLTSIVKRFGSTAESHLSVSPDKDLDKINSKPHKRLSAGFMGKKWDGGDVAFRPETWAAVMRVLKPGSYLIAFSGTRTFHRMACAIEDAGFDIRDQIGWCFGSGFPKSHNLGNGWGTALKPAWEPICLARKPFTGTNAANMAEHGVGGLNIDGCRVTGNERPNCIDRCHSPTACGGFGYCRRRNKDGLPDEETKRQ
jgi:site-specific DNA-methyltransferase (adenine-specific)